MKVPFKLFINAISQAGLRYAGGILMLQHYFMKYALAAILVITPLFGMMGTMVVHKKMAFFSDALGHSALTGIAAGVVLGVANVNLSLIVFAVLFALF